MSAIPTCLFGFVSVLTGLAAYSYYEGCDPLISGKIDKPDEIILRLALEIFHDKPGLVGLFVSAAFCGTMRYEKILSKHVA